MHIFKSVQTLFALAYRVALQRAKSFFHFRRIAQIRPWKTMKRHSSTSLLAGVKVGRVHLCRVAPWQVTVCDPKWQDDAP